MSILPPEVRAGYVYDRVLRAIGDRPYDDDRLPDGIPAQGMVIFRPKTSVKQIVSDGRGVTVTREPVTCTIHQGEDQPDDPDASKGGLLIDEAGAVGGVWLVVGEWTAEYHMEDRYSNIPNEEIIVTEEHTKDNPLDVALASEITPTPTQKFVVNEQIYVDSQKARDEALVFRNDAQEAFEQFTWPVQVQDTPPENTDVIWVNPDEPAGTASDWALRAEAAAAASQALGITVDTSVGTRVFVGDTMIHGSTGLRQVLPTEGKSADIRVMRHGNTVSVTVISLIQNESGIFFILPAGFRPSAAQYLRAYWNSTATVTTNGNFSSSHSGTGGENISVTYLTRDDWPTSLPGSPL